MENNQNTTPSATTENATTSPEVALTQTPNETGQSAASSNEAAHQTAEAVTKPTEVQPPDATLNDGDNQEGIPEKWVGKSLDDILKANKELEKKMHQQSEELSRFRKEQEAPVAKPVQAETYAQPPQAQVTPPVQAVKGMDEWLNEEFDKDWSQDPQTAVPRDRQRRDQWRAYQDNYTKQMEFGEAATKGQIVGMEDFGELVPSMQQIAKNLAPLINPVYETHPELLRTVYYIAKGMTSSDKLKKIATAKTQVSKAVEQEKIAAASETTSSSEGNPTVSPWDMKPEDLKKLIGVADRSVEG